MAPLGLGTESSADATAQTQLSMTMAACISTFVLSASCGTFAVEVSLDAILGFIVVAALIGISPVLRQRARESTTHLQKLCCKRNVSASVELWPTQSATAARRTRNKEEIRFLIDAFKGHAQKGNLEGMMQLLKEIEKSWLPHLDMPHYHSLIQSLGKGGNPVAAHMWLRRSMAAGFRPWHSTFNAVINPYIKNKDFDEALQVADEMMSAGLKYDTATYNMVIDVWARKGDAHRAQSWMWKLLDDRIQPNIIGFSAVMRACAEAGLHQDLEGWFETSQSYGFALDLLGFRSLLRVFAKKQDAVNAAKWLDVMIEQGVQPGSTEFILVFKTILTCDEVGLAIRLMDQVRVVGVQLPAMMIGECVAMAVKHGYHSKAQAWADKWAAGKVGVGEAATVAMREEALTVPAFDMGNRQNSSQDSVDARAEGGATSVGCAANMAARRAAAGCHYVGVIKESNPYQYGFIMCPATYEVFEQDVWFSQDENKEGLTKGQSVSFRLRVDNKGRPRACDMTVSR